MVKLNTLENLIIMTLKLFSIKICIKIILVTLIILKKLGKISTCSKCGYKTKNLMKSINTHVLKKRLIILKNIVLFGRNQEILL